MGNAINVQAEREGQWAWIKIIVGTIWEDPGKVHGHCRWGRDMAILHVLIPKIWIAEDKLLEVEEHGFGTGQDRQVSVHMNHSSVLECKIEDLDHLANSMKLKFCAVKTERNSSEFGRNG